MLKLPAAALETFDRNVRSFVAIAVAGGSRAVLVTQPLRVRSGTAEADRAYLAQWLLGLDPTAVPAQLERLNSVRRELTTAGPAVLADAARDVAWSDTDFGDPMHFSGDGSARMARFMADIVEGISHGSGGTENGSRQQSSGR